MKAHAVVFTAPNTVRFQEVTCPDPGPDDLVVRVTHSWISNGTEGSYLRGERIAGDTPYRDGDAWPFPIVAGYQKVGVVERVGENITDIAVGETVFATMGAVNGMFEPRGGQVSPSVCRRDGVWKLPPVGSAVPAAPHSGVAAPVRDPLAFAGMVLTQVGYNCGARPRVGMGDGAVVVGDGLVGQWAAQTLAWRGADVVLVGRHDDRLARFGPAPFRQVVNARSGDWKSAIRDLLPQGVKIGVDTVGSVELVMDLFDVMVRFGHLVSAGFYGTQDAVALQPLRYKELAVHLVSGWWPDRMEHTRQLIAAGYLETLPLITHRFPVSQAAEAWELIEGKREPVLGVILDWDGV